MRILLLSALTIALLFSCGTNENTKKETVDVIETVVDKKSSWATSHLKGMVKTIEETSYTPDESGKIGEMDSCCVEIKEFNDKGYATRNSEKDINGAPGVVSVIEFDGDKFVSVTRTRDGNPVWSRTVRYGDDGKAAYAEDTDSTGQVTMVHTILTANELDQSLSGTSHTPDSVYLGTWSWIIVDGMRTGGSWVDSTGTLRSERIGELNDKGFLTKKTRMSVDEDGNATTTVETYTYDSYDETGNWTQRSKYVDAKLDKVEKRTYAYFE